MMYSSSLLGPDFQIGFGPSCCLVPGSKEQPSLRNSPSEPVLHAW